MKMIKFVINVDKKKDRIKFLKKLFNKFKNKA